MLRTGSDRSFCVFLPCGGYGILFLDRKRTMVFPLLLFRQPIIVIQAVWYGFYVFHAHGIFILHPCMKHDGVPPAGGWSLGHSVRSPFM